MVVASPLRILIVEDQFVIAASLEDILREDGHEPVGPVATLSAAVALLRDGEEIHAAILNLMLDGERVDPLCVLLQERGVPFAFASGVHADDYGHWSDYPRIEKPYQPDQVRELIARLLRR